MHHRFGLGDLVITAGQRNQLPLAAGRTQHLVDALAVVRNQGIGSLENRGRRAVVLLQFHHGAGGLIGLLVSEVVLKAHQDREVRRPEAVDALIGIAHHKHRPTCPVVVGLGILAVSDQQLDQVVLGAVGVLIFIHQHMGETAVPVAAHLLVLLQQLHRHQQQVIEIEGIVGREGLAVAPVHVGGEFSPLPLGIGLELIGQPPLILSVTDRPTGFFRFEALGVKLKLLGHNLLHQALGIGLVVDGELLGPRESFAVLELVDVVAEHPCEKGMEGADPQLLGDFPVDA